eukprot:m.202391 g.202391  ORF g.202391 m.202391 type:complete len:216 (+) comp17064_c0_seq19:1078-1725(+)
MGTSHFSEYTVVAEISCAKINDDAPLDVVGWLAAYPLWPRCESLHRKVREARRCSQRQNRMLVCKRMHACLLAIPSLFTSNHTNVLFAHRCVSLAVVSPRVLEPSSTPQRASYLISSMCSLPLKMTNKCLGNATVGPSSSKRCINWIVSLVIQALSLFGTAKSRLKSQPQDFAFEEQACDRTILVHPSVESQRRGSSVVVPAQQLLATGSRSRSF